MTIPELYGAVLIGGKSTRMGTDKSQLQYHSTSQREHTYTLLQNFCSKVYLSCNEDQKTTTPLPCIIDDQNLAGPLAGIISIFKRHPEVAWLIVACDMPFLDEKVLKTLIKNRDPLKIATCFIQKFPEPMCTIWEPAAYPLLQNFVASGQLQPIKFLQRPDVKHLSVDAVPKDAFRNINTPEERENVRHKGI